MTSFEDFLNAGGDDLSQVETKKTNPKFERKKFTCEDCGGTGRWHGGRNRHGNAKCNTCHGNGFLVTSPEARANARAASRKAKVVKIEAAKEQNADHGNGHLLAWLTSVSEWNDFAASLMQQHRDGRAWSDKQVAAAERMYVKVKASQAAKAEAKAKREAEAPVIDLSRIEDLFSTAKKSGYKKPSFRAEGLVLKPAHESGRNAGAIYVMDEQKVEYGAFGPTPAYAGKVANAKFHAVRDAGEYVLPALERIAANPLEVALRYGQRTGRCACCGRELTKHSSIEAGIGPICAQKWGLA